MQQKPVQRTIRLIILSVGFVLFVMLAFRSASQISDPRFIKGKPFLFGHPQAAAAVSAADNLAETVAPVAVEVSSNTTSSTPVHETEARSGRSPANGHTNKPEVVTAAEHVTVPQSQGAEKAVAKGRD